MKVLILTVPLGNGHNAVAGAISNCFNELGVQNEIIDVYEYIQPKLKEVISKIHLFSMKSAAAIKDLATNIYDLNEKRDISSEYSLSQLKNKIMASELLKYILQYEPDVIICTQVYAAQIIDILEEEKKITSITVGIITDFTVQTYWQDTKNIDYIVTGSEQLNIQLKNRNISIDKALPFGIPISNKFLYKDSKYETCQKLGIKNDIPTVLIMGGGMGLGNIDEYISQIDVLDFDLQMLVVCGNNAKLYQKLKDTNTNKYMKLYEYIDFVDELMNVADCILSKPGGITISESLAKGVPIVMIDPLPGIEDRNVEFLLNNGAALYVTKTYMVNEALGLLLTSPKRCNTITEAIKSLAKPNATKDLCDFLINNIKNKSI